MGSFQRKRPPGEGRPAEAGLARSAANAARIAVYLGLAWCEGFSLKGGDASLNEPTVVDLRPEGEPPRLSAARRLLCGAVGLAFLAVAVYCFTSPTFSGFGALVGAMLATGGAILTGSALFPSLTLQKIDRSRWR